MSTGLTLIGSSYDDDENAEEYAPEICTQSNNTQNNSEAPASAVDHEKMASVESPKSTVECEISIKETAENARDCATLPVQLNLPNTQLSLCQDKEHEDEGRDFHKQCDSHGTVECSDNLAATSRCNTDICFRVSNSSCESNEMDVNVIDDRSLNVKAQTSFSESRTVSLKIDICAAAPLSSDSSQSVILQSAVRSIEQQNDDTFLTAQTASQNVSEVDTDSGNFDSLTVSTIHTCEKSELASSDKDVFINAEAVAQEVPLCHDVVIENGSRAAIVHDAVECIEDSSLLQTAGISSVTLNAASENICKNIVDIRVCTADVSDAVLHEDQQRDILLPVQPTLSQATEGSDPDCTNLIQREPGEASFNNFVQQVNKFCNNESTVDMSNAPPCITNNVTSEPVHQNTDNVLAEEKRNPIVCITQLSPELKSADKNNTMSFNDVFLHHIKQTDDVISKFVPSNLVQQQLVDVVKARKIPEQAADANASRRPPKKRKVPAAVTAEVTTNVSQAIAVNSSLILPMDVPFTTSTVIGANLPMTSEEALVHDIVLLQKLTNEVSQTKKSSSKKPNKNKLKETVAADLVKQDIIKEVVAETNYVDGNKLLLDKQSEVTVNGGSSSIGTEKRKAKSPKSKITKKMSTALEESGGDIKVGVTPNRNTANAAGRDALVPDVVCCKKPRGRSPKKTWKETSTAAADENDPAVHDNAALNVVTGSLESKKKRLPPKQKKVVSEMSVTEVVSAIADPQLAPSSVSTKKNAKRSKNCLAKDSTALPSDHFPQYLNTSGDHDKLSVNFLTNHVECPIVGDSTTSGLSESNISILSKQTPMARKIADALDKIAGALDTSGVATVEQNQSLKSGKKSKAKKNLKSCDPKLQIIDSVSDPLKDDGHLANDTTSKQKRSPKAKSKSVAGELANYIATSLLPSTTVSVTEAKGKRKAKAKGNINLDPSISTAGSEIGTSVLADGDQVAQAVILKDSESNEKNPKESKKSKKNKKIVSQPIETEDLGLPCSAVEKYEPCTIKCKKKQGAKIKLLSNPPNLESAETAASEMILLKSLAKMKAPKKKKSLLTESSQLVVQSSATMLINHCVPDEVTSKSDSDTVRNQTEILSKLEKKKSSCKELKQKSRKIVSTVGNATVSDDDHCNRLMQALASMAGSSILIKESDTQIRDNQDVAAGNNPNVTGDESITTMKSKISNGTLAKKSKQRVKHTVEGQQPPSNNCNTDPPPLHDTAIQQQGIAVADVGKSFACSQCSYVARKKGQLRKHLGVHKIYACAHCDHTSDGQEGLDKHMIQRHPSRCGRRLCKRCHVLFRTDSFVLHEAECTGEKRGWDCVVCGKRFKFVSAMRMHVRRWHDGSLNAAASEDPDNCFSTSVISPTESTKTDESVAIGISQINDDVQSFPIHTATVVNSEVTAANSNLIVPVGNKTTTFSGDNRSILYGSTKATKSVDSGVNVSCDQKFEKSRKIESGGLPFQCNLCSRSFKSHSSLSKHKSFKHKKSQVESLISATAVEPSVVFGTRSVAAVDLSVHDVGPSLDGVAGAAPTQLRCSFAGCGKEFKILLKLIRHAEKHTGEKPYHCDWPGCRKSFLYVDNFKSHRLQHTDPKPYPCDQCSVGYWQKCSLKAHQLRVHSDGAGGDAKKAEMITGNVEELSERKSRNSLKEKRVRGKKRRETASSENQSKEQLTTDINKQLINSTELSAETKQLQVNDGFANTINMLKDECKTKAEEVTETAKTKNKRLVSAKEKRSKSKKIERRDGRMETVDMFVIPESDDPVIKQDGVIISNINTVKNEEPDVCCHTTKRKRAADKIKTKRMKVSKIDTDELISDKADEPVITTASCSIDEIIAYVASAGVDDIHEKTTCDAMKENIQSTSSMQTSRVSSEVLSGNSKVISVYEFCEEEQDVVAELKPIRRAVPIVKDVAQVSPQGIINQLSSSMYAAEVKACDTKFKSSKLLSPLHAAKIKSSGFSQLSSLHNTDVKPPLRTYLKPKKVDPAMLTTKPTEDLIVTKPPQLLTKGAKKRRIDLAMQSDNIPLENSIVSVNTDNNIDKISSGQKVKRKRKSDVTEVELHVENIESVAKKKKLTGASKKAGAAIGSSVSPVSNVSNTADEKTVDDVQKKTKDATSRKKLSPSLPVIKNKKKDVKRRVETENINIICEGTVRMTMIEAQIKIMEMSRDGRRQYTKNTTTTSSTKKSKLSDCVKNFPEIKFTTTTDLGNKKTVGKIKIGSGAKRGRKRVAKGRKKTFTKKLITTKDDSEMNVKTIQSPTKKRAAAKNRPKRVYHKKLDTNMRSSSMKGEIDAVTYNPELSIVDAVSRIAKKRNKQGLQPAIFDDTTSSHASMDEHNVKLSEHNDDMKGKHHVVAGRSIEYYDDTDGNYSSNISKTISKNDHILADTGKNQHHGNVFSGVEQRSDEGEREMLSEELRRPQLLKLPAVISTCDQDESSCSVSPLSESPGGTNDIDAPREDDGVSDESPPTLSSQGVHDQEDDDSVPSPQPSEMHNKHRISENERNETYPSSESHIGDQEQEERNSQDPSSPPLLRGRDSVDSDDIQPPRSNECIKITTHQLESEYEEVDQSVAQSYNAVPDITAPQSRDNHPGDHRPYVAGDRSPSVHSSDYTAEKRFEGGPSSYMEPERYEISNTEQRQYHSSQNMYRPQSVSPHEQERTMENVSRENSMYFYSDPSAVSSAMYHPGHYPHRSDRHPLQSLEGLASGADVASPGSGAGTHYFEQQQSPHAKQSAYHSGHQQNHRHHRSSSTTSYNMTSPDEYSTNPSGSNLPAAHSGGQTSSHSSHSTANSGQTVDYGRVSDPRFMHQQRTSPSVENSQLERASGAATAAPGFPSDSFAKDFFGQYFHDPSSHIAHLGGSSGQDQRSVGGSGYLTSQPTAASRSRAQPPDLFQRAPSSNPLISNTSYPSSIAESFLAVKPPPGLPQASQSHHWSAAGPTAAFVERSSRPWSQIPSEIGMEGVGSSRNSYRATDYHPSEAMLSPEGTPKRAASTRPVELTVFPSVPSTVPSVTHAGTTQLSGKYTVPSAYSSLAAAYSPTAAAGVSGYSSHGGPSSASHKHLEEAYRHAAQLSDYRTLAAAQAHHPPMAPDVAYMAGINPGALTGFDRYYYTARDAMYRSHQLATMPHHFMPQGASVQHMSMYGDRNTAATAYGRDGMYSQPSPYSFMAGGGGGGDKQYLSSGASGSGNNSMHAAPPTTPQPADYLQNSATADTQDPYRRSVIYNMMSPPRYF